VPGEHSLGAPDAAPRSPVRPPRGDVSFEMVRAVVDLIDTPITLLNLDGRIRHLNPAYARLLGREPGDLQGLPVEAVLPASGPGWRADFARGAGLFRRLLARGSGRAVFPNQRRDGTIVQVEVVAELFRRRDRDSSWILARVTDLGGQINQLDAQVTALRQLAAASDDLLAKIVRVAREVVGAHYAAIELTENDRIVRIVQDGVSEVDGAAIGRLPEGHGMLGAMLAAPGAIRVADIGADRRASGYPEGHPPIRSFLGVPMEAGSRRYGHLFFGDKIDLDEFTIIDERLAEVFAIHAAIAIRDERERGVMATTIEALRTRDRERERLLSAIEQAPDPIWILEPDGTIAYANTAVGRLYGYEPEELLGRTPAVLDGGSETAEFWDEMWTTVRGGRAWSGTIRNRAKDGSIVQIDSTVSPVVDSAGKVTAIIAADRDVTRERALESDIERQARERESIEAALRGIDPTWTPERIAAAACTEIIRLSDVGSAAVFDLTPGAESVLGVAGLMSDQMVPGAPIPDRTAMSLRARTIAGPWIHDARLDPVEASASKAVAATGLQMVAYAPFSSPHGTFGIIGIGSHDPQTAPRLVERLSALAIFGSLLGVLLGPGLDSRHRGTEAQAEVQATLDAAAFSSLFQPILDLETGRIAGYEALTRFSNHETAASAFAAAARAGLGVELETATLVEAVNAAEVLPADVFLSLNASPEFIASGEVARILAGGSRPIVLEITEHVPIVDYPSLRSTLSGLGPRVRLAVDDAGAGFASFRHILELAPDFVKLDIGLVRGIDSDPARQALVAGMVFFAAERQLRLIAEGIETAAELATVRRLGVPLGQGFFLGRPRADGGKRSSRRIARLAPAIVDPDRRAP
jgi:PAS domain S-box-containing protein